MENFKSPMQHHPLGIAARYNDAECEEHGLATTIERQDLSFNDTLYLAEQRGLRIMAMNHPNLRHLLGNHSRPIAVHLTHAQKLEMAIYTSAVLDGILIGWRARGLNDKEMSDARDI